MASTAAVYTGFWINWTSGRIAGSTLTLTSRDGAYLVAFLALFVRVAGNGFWGILRYTIFRLRSRPIARDELSHQQQAILRNVTADVNALCAFVKAGLSGHKEEKNHPLRRSGWFVVLAFANIAAFTVAGIFSSKVTAAKSEVLLRPVLCGGWSPANYINSTGGWSPAVINSTNPPEQAFQIEMDFDVYQEQSFVTSQQYASLCYGTNVSSNNCNAYGRQPLNWTMSTSESCPFAPEMCANSPTVRLDSGYIDSAIHLGINAPQEDRITYRDVVECAPLVTNGFTSGYPGKLANETEIPPPGFAGPGEWGPADQSDLFVSYYYGNNTVMGTNATFIWDNNTFTTSYGTFWDLDVYQLDVEWYTLIDWFEDDSFIPIPQLQRDNAQVSLIFLMKMAAFWGPVTDPWFSATTLVPQEQYLPNFTIPAYTSAEPVAVLGCTEQQYFCNPQYPGGQLCVDTSLGQPTDGVGANNSVYQALGYNDKQRATASRLFINPFWAPVNCLGQRSMLATSMVSFGQDYSNPLPANQWMLEVQNWFATTLTSMQLSVVQYVTGYDNPLFDQYVVAPMAADEWMCSHQIVQRDDYASFSVLGLGIILAIGGVMIIVNLVLPSVVDYFTSRSPAGRFKTHEWDVDEMLYLQRQAYGVRGVEQWPGQADPPPSRRGSAHEKSRRSSWLPLLRKSQVQADVGEITPSLRSQSTTGQSLEVRVQQDDFPPGELVRFIADASSRSRSE